MTRRQSLLILLTLGWLVSIGAAGHSPSTASVDDSIYVKLLADYVKDGVVNYQGFKKEETKLDEYLQVINFFLKYAAEDLKKGLTAGKGRIEVRYLEYDWTLNGE
jgi:hypothetical protein